MEKEYQVGLIRIRYGHAYLRVTATSKKEAEEKALDQAGNLDFLEHDSEHKVSTIMEVN